MVHSPMDPALTPWRELYHRATAANGGEADAGRFLLSCVMRAGFADPVVTYDPHLSPAILTCPASRSGTADTS